MLIAGEPSGDLLAAELVEAIKDSAAKRGWPFPPEFFGAGGPHMAAAGVQLEIDLTAHSVVGLSDVLAQYFKFAGFFQRLFRLALERQPDVIILVDFGGFNLRFAKAIKRYIRTRAGRFNNWNPKIVYYVSPQVWASRAGRAHQLARNVDLLLSIFPFEKAWYAARVPRLRVEFAGHPLIDRYSRAERGVRSAEHINQGLSREDWGSEADDSHRLTDSPAHPLVVLLPGSRKRELEAHLPVMVEAAGKIRSTRSIRTRMVLPNSELAQFAARWLQPIRELEVRTEGLAESLSEAHLAIASSGTVTLECAYFRVPTVVVYKTAWLTYQIAKQIITVKYIAMPNILAGEMVYPELTQSAAIADQIANAALDLLNDSSRLTVLKSKLAKIIDSLGGPGASQRAAEAVLSLLESSELNR